MLTSPLNCRRWCSFSHFLSQNFVKSEEHQRWQVKVTLGRSITALVGGDVSIPCLAYANSPSCRTPKPTSDSEKSQRTIFYREAWSSDFSHYKHINVMNVWINITSLNVWLLPNTCTNLIPMGIQIQYNLYAPYCTFAQCLCDHFNTHYDELPAHNPVYT